MSWSLICNENTDKIVILVSFRLQSLSHSWIFRNEQPRADGGPLRNSQSGVCCQQLPQCCKPRPQHRLQPQFRGEMIFNVHWNLRIKVWTGLDVVLFPQGPLIATAYTNGYHWARKSAILFLVFYTIPEIIMRFLLVQSCRLTAGRTWSCFQNWSDPSWSSP